MQPGAAGARRWVKRLQPYRSAIYDICSDRRADARADLCTDPVAYPSTHAISEPSKPTEHGYSRADYEWMDFLAEQNSESSEPDEHGYSRVDYEHMSIAQHATSESSEPDEHGSSRADYERVGVEHVSTHYDYSSESEVDVQTLRIVCNSKAARRQRADH